MHTHHNARGFRIALGKKLFENQYNEIHWGEVVVEQDHFVEVGLLRFWFGSCYDLTVMFGAILLTHICRYCTKVGVKRQPQVETGATSFETNLNLSRATFDLTQDPLLFA